MGGNLNITIDNDLDRVVNIKVVGVGGGGGNAVNRMASRGIKLVDFIVVNTDQQVLTQSKATQRIQIGEKSTKGRGAGGDPERGKKAAEESRDEIAVALAEANMVFITAGMGGGTGTGGAPVVASVARELGILTVGIVTKPFNFEGKRRMEQAEAGIAELRQYVDSLLVIPNERLKALADSKITLTNAFEAADNVLGQGVQSISDLINENGFINLDFADVMAIMKDAGLAHMGVGAATGKNKAEEAAQIAISSPLLETTIDGAKGVIINFTAPPTIELAEIDKAMEKITKLTHPSSNIIFGVVMDEELEDEIRVTVIATGFDTSEFKPKIAKKDVNSTSTAFTEVLKSPKEEEFDPDNGFGDVLELFSNKRR